MFQSILPTIGYGALPSVEPTPQNDTPTDSEPIFHKPRSPAWPSLGADCALQGVGVTLFLAPSRFMDIASISTVANTTGGSIFFHPRFEQVRDGSVFKGQLRRILKRMQGYDCMMRVRCSKGMFIRFPLISHINYLPLVQASKLTNTMEISISRINLLRS